MDNMLISSKMLTDIVSKILTKTIEKQLGKGIRVHVNNVGMKTEEGTINLHLDVDASISGNELQAILSKGGLL